jgi:hypothetical protein
VPRDAYPRFYRGIKDMIGGALLETATARAIARKGIRTLTPAGEGAAAALGPRLWGQWSVLGEDDSAYRLDYLAEEEFGFPFGSGPGDFIPGEAKRYGDSRSAGEGRLVVNVLEAGEAGSVLSVRISGGGFIGTPPFCPLDEVGLHFSEWVAVDLPPAPTPADSALLYWVVENPASGTGFALLGTCQFQVR